MLDCRRLPRQMGRYVHSFAWLIRESVRVADAEWRRLILATFVFLCGNAALLGTIFLYVSLLEHNHPVQLPPLVLQPRESMLLLTAFIAVVTLGLLTIATSEYIVRTAALRMFRRYQEESTRVALRLAQRLPTGCAPELAAPAAGSGLRRYYTEYPRSCGWTMRFIANAFPSLMLLCLGFILLVWLDLLIALLVFLLGLLLVAAQYPSNLFAASASNIVDQTRSAVAQRLRTLAARIEQIPVQYEADDSTAVSAERFFDDPVARRHQAAQYDRYRALELSALTMQAGGGVMLAFLLFIIVRGPLMEGGEWATLAVYATLFRQLLGNATSIFRAVTVFSRFSPHINAFRSLVMSLERSRCCAPPPLPTSLTLAARPLDGEEASPALHRGERFHIISRNNPGRRLALDLQAIVFEANPAGVGPPGARPCLPSIHYRTAHEEQSAKSLETVLRRLLEQFAGIFLLDNREYSSLDQSARGRVSEFVRTGALAIVSAKTPRKLAQNALLLVQDLHGRWYWVRVGEAGLSQSNRRKIEALLRRPSDGAADGSVGEDEFE